MTAKEETSMPSKPNPKSENEPVPETQAAEVADFLITFMRRVMDLKPEWERYERELIDQSFGDTSANRIRTIEDNAATVWDRLQSDGGVAAQADYALLRSGLGRRVRPDGPLADLSLEVGLSQEGLSVEGHQLLGSIGLAFRWGEFWQNTEVVAFGTKAARHIVPIELPEGVPVQVIAFDSSSVTGFAVVQRATVLAETGA